MSFLSANTLWEPKAYPGQAGIDYGLLKIEYFWKSLRSVIFFDRSFLILIPRKQAFNIQSVPEFYCRMDNFLLK